jgi:hypothetical protein
MGYEDTCDGPSQSWCKNNTVPLFQKEHLCPSAIPLVEQLASAAVPQPLSDVKHTNASLCLFAVAAAVALLLCLQLAERRNEESCQLSRC